MATYLSGFNTGPSQAAYLAQLEAQRLMNPGLAQYGSALPMGVRTAGGAAGGAASSGSGGGLPGSYLDAYNEARAANEQRYEDILTGYQDRSNQYQENAAGLRDDVLNGYDARYQRGMQNLEGLGNQEKIDVQRQFGELAAANQQDLVNRGLTGTTIMPTMRQGILREQTDALSRINERLQNQRLGLDASLSGDGLSAQERLGQSILSGTAGMQGDTLQFAERRSDTYPDFNQLAALAQSYGAAGGMAGMNGGASPFAPQWNSMQSLGYQMPQPIGNFVQPWWFQPDGFGQQQQQPMAAGMGNAIGGALNGAFNPAGGNQAPAAPWGVDGSQQQSMGGMDGMPSSGDPQLDAAYEQVVAILGRPPTSVEEAMWALDQAHVQTAAIPGYADFSYGRVVA